MMFFLNSESDAEPKPFTKSKKSARPSTNGHTSPLKNKTVGGKVLRTKTRGAQAESQSASQKIAEHQAELHAQLHKDGLAKYSEAGEGSGGKEGQGWKKFQSYKGEAALPKEVESLRVCFIFNL